MPSLNFQYMISLFMSLPIRRLALVCELNCIGLGSLCSVAVENWIICKINWFNNRVTLGDHIP